MKKAAEERHLIKNSRRKKSTFSPVVRRSIILRNACNALERNQIFNTYDFDLLSRPIYLLDLIADSYETDQDRESFASVDVAPAIEQENSDSKRVADIDAFSEMEEPTLNSNQSAISDIQIDHWEEELNDFLTPRLNNAFTDEKSGERNFLAAKGSSTRTRPAMKKMLTTVHKAGPEDSFEFTLNKRRAGGRKRQDTIQTYPALAELQQIDDEFTRELSDGEREQQEHKKNAETLKRNLQRKFLKEALTKRKVNFSKGEQEPAPESEGKGDDQLRKLKMISKTPGQKADSKRKTSTRRVAAGNKGSLAVGMVEGIGQKGASTAARKAEPMVLKEWEKSKKAIEDNQLQVIANFVHFNV